MYFVTMKRAGYCLFTTTPSGRLAVGVTDDQKRLHLFLREESGWTTIRDWSVEEFSHTDLLLKLGSIDEPEDPHEILQLLPTGTVLH